MSLIDALRQLNQQAEQRMKVSDEREVKKAKIVQEKLEAKENRWAKKLIAIADREAKKEAKLGNNRVTVTSIPEDKIKETSWRLHGANWQRYHADDLLGVPQLVARHYENEKGFRIRICEEDFGPHATSAIRPHILMDIEWD